MLSPDDSDCSGVSGPFTAAATTADDVAVGADVMTAVGAAVVVVPDAVGAVPDAATGPALSPSATSPSTLSVLTVLSDVSDDDALLSIPSSHGTNASDEARMRMRG